VVEASVGCHRSKVNEEERRRREIEKGIDMKAVRVGVCSSCFAGVVKRETMDVRF
jgi:hypothetical protein